MLAALLCRATAQALQKKAYGPALTPAERQKWFRVDTESPIALAAKRKALERIKREEFGIIPREEIEAIVESLVAEKVEALPQAPITGRSRIDIEAIASRIALAIAPRIRAEIAAMDEENEEEEAVGLFLLH